MRTTIDIVFARVPPLVWLRAAFSAWLLGGVCVTAAVLFIFVAAAVITPDGNPVVQVMVAGPMVVLYLLGIGAAWLFGKSKKQDQAAH